MKQNEPPPPLGCDGKYPEWQILPQVPGQPGRAVARCCGVKAVLAPGGWMIEPDEPRGSP
jgi:hypothetical protein